MNPHTLVSPAAWTAAGWTMLHVGWIGAGGGLIAALLRRALRGARPEVRHAVALGCLLALTAAPPIVFAWVYDPAPEEGRLPRVGRVATAAAGTTVRDPAATTPLTQPRRAPMPARPTAPASARLEPIVGYLPGVWLAGSLATLALVATGLLGAERLRRSSLALEAHAVAGRCRALADSLGVARRIGVAACDRIAAPVLIGIVRPMILLPPAALCGWSVEQLEMALLHELAHVRRWDNLVVLLQRLAESLLFFHPVAWWLSAWVALERELACDRMVVERTGRPQAYARLLAELAGARAPGLASAMAERPLTTRIRRILDMEDRSMRMRMTMSEGLGLIAAAILGAGLALPTHAGPPRPAPDEARRTLQRMAEDVIALPEGKEVDSKGEALYQIARAQLKLGDRDGALTTLGRLDVLAESAPAKPGAKLDVLGWGRLCTLIVSAELRDDAGDHDGARAVLGRASQYLESRDDAVASAFRRMSAEVNARMGEKPEGERRLNDMEAAFACEAAEYLIDQLIALGAREQARPLIRRTVDAIGPVRGPVDAAMVASLGAYLVKAGDPDGRDLIAGACRAVRALDNADARAFALPRLARTLSDAGDLDGALAMVQELPPSGRQAALTGLIEGMTVDNHEFPWLDLSGMTIKIGEPSLSPKDPAAARAALPRIAAAARAAGDTRVEARTLAAVALLQARAGDLAGALATARSIPALHWSDFPGRRDGFYEAVRPAALARVAGVQARGGDRAAAAAVLDEAEALARAIGAEDQRLVAQVVIAQEQVAAGRLAAAKAVVAEAVPLALDQPEPRRSRVLTMLAEVQAQADDVDGALRTADAIRDYPGLEKARALTVLARRRRDAGHGEASEALLRRAAASLESKGPGSAAGGPVLTIRAFARDTFIDFDLELDATVVKRERDARLRDTRAELGDVDAVVRGAKGLPPAHRDAVLSQLAGNLARRGDVTGALDLATSIDSPDGRLNAFATLAEAIPQR